MSLRQTPFPKPSFSSFLRVITAISATIVFILIVFQPFGTTNFDHNAKYWILLGYGGITLLSGTIFHLLVNAFTSEERLNRWSVADEVIFLFFIILICQVSCYLYWAAMFGNGLKWSHFFSFFRLASLISIFPISVYLLFIYSKYKEVKFITSSEKEAKTSLIDNEQIDITIYGSGKNEKIQVSKANLLLIKSEDNYAILFLNENGRIIKRMMRNTLNDVEGQLGTSFFRCHRSFIVNPSKITEIEGNITNTKISITDIDIKIPVSRAMVEKVKLLI